MLVNEKKLLKRHDCERMNLPEEFWKVKIQEVAESVRPVVAKYLLRIREMVARGYGLCLFGSAGVGKTSIAALIAKEARANGYTVFFTGVWELREATRSRIDFEDTTSMLDRCREVQVLVLDNITKEEGSEIYINAKVISELLLYRNNKKLVTIITTRLSVIDLSKAMPSIVDALEGKLAPINVIGVNKKTDKHSELISYLIK